MNTIEVKIGLCSATYTHQEIEQKLHELVFFQEALLTLINPDEASKSDLPFNREQIMRKAKPMYEGCGYSQEFINKIFKK